MDDVISRQVAIDLWEKYHPRIAVDAMQYDAELRQLPPAQPEQRWIPCSERLPEYGKTVLWCNDKGSIFTTAITYMNALVLETITTMMRMVI